MAPTTAATTDQGERERETLAEAFVALGAVDSNTCVDVVGQHRAHRCTILDARTGFLPRDHQRIPGISRDTVEETLSAGSRRSTPTMPSR